MRCALAGAANLEVRERAQDQHLPAGYLYGLMFFVLGKTTWMHVLTHEGAWQPEDAMAWCVWTAFATLAGLGLVRSLEMLPILLLEIFYQVQWLLIVAYLLWSKGQLDGSTSADEPSAFLRVLLPIVARPWGYAFRTSVFTDAGASIRTRRCRSWWKAASARNRGGG